MNIHQTQKRAAKIKEKNLKIRNRLWPDLDENQLWDRRKKKGFTTIPRTMPLILHIIDDLSVGKPLSLTYLTLWCRVFDDAMVTIQNPRELAFESGFSRQRAESTWTSRMKILIDHGLIDAKSGPSGDYNYVLIWNPYLIIKELFEKGKVQETQYTALFSRAQDIGATDLD